MEWFAIVKRHYDAQRYTNEDVKKFVVASKISAEEYLLITSEVYVA